MGTWGSSAADSYDDEPAEAAAAAAVVVEVVRVESAAAGTPARVAARNFCAVSSAPVEAVVVDCTPAVVPPPRAVAVAPDTRALAPGVVAVPSAAADVVVLSTVAPAVDLTVDNHRFG